MSRRMPSLRMIFVALVVSLGGSFHFGYQLALTNPAQDAFIRFLNETLGSHFIHNGSHGLSKNTLTNIWSFIVAILFLGALAGSFTIRPIADYIGRKRGLYISIGFGMMSAGMSVVSKFIPSILLYIISRVCIGFSVSLSLGLAALFLSEASPKECRGSIGMITGTCVQFGTVVGSIIAMPQVFGTFNLWYLIYVSEVVMMGVFVILLPLLPESPGYLVQRGAHEAAKKSLIYYYKCSDVEAEEYLQNIKEEQKRSVKKYTMIDVIRIRPLRRKAVVGMVVTFAMSFSGVAVINAYAFEILTDTGLQPLQASLANVAIAFVSMVAIIISSMVIDKFGRRPLLLLAFTGCLICNFFIFALMLTFDHYKYQVLGFLLIFVICIFIVFFAIGPGPLCYFINAELVEQSARSAAQSWASVVQMLSRFIIVTIFLPMKNSLGEYSSYLILFVIPVAASIVYLYFYLPETKNKTAIEVDEAIQRLPTVHTLTKKKDKIHVEKL